MVGLNGSLVSEQGTVYLTDEVQKANHLSVVMTHGGIQSVLAKVGAIAECRVTYQGKQGIWLLRGTNGMGNLANDRWIMLGLARPVHVEGDTQEIRAQDFLDYAFTRDEAQQSQSFTSSWSYYGKNDRVTYTATHFVVPRVYVTIARGKLDGNTNVKKDLDGLSKASVKSFNVDSYTASIEGWIKKARSTPDDVAVCTRLIKDAFSLLSLQSGRQVSMAEVIAAIKL
jgi:hypothetical protein